VQTVAAIDVGDSWVKAAVDLGRGDGPTPIQLDTGDFAAPSLVSVDANGTSRSGKEAAAARARNVPTISGPRRLLGDPTPVVLGSRGVSVSALVGAQITQSLAVLTRLLEAQPDRVVLTVPAAWGPYRHQQLLEVATHCGLPDVQLITEPEAAFARAVDDDGKDLTAVVCDIGGTSVNLNVVRRRHQRTALLGQAVVDGGVSGAVFDAALRDLLDQHSHGAVGRLDPDDDVEALRTIKAKCAQARHALSTTTSASVDLKFIGAGTIEVGRDEFVRCLEPCLSSLLLLLERTLDSAHVRQDEVDVIVLVGGASVTSSVDSVLAEFGRPVCHTPQPQHAIALGAASLVVAARTNRGSGSAVTPPPARRLSTGRTRLGRRPRLGWAAVTVALVVAAIAAGIHFALAPDRPSPEGPRLPVSLPDPVGIWSMRVQDGALVDSVAQTGNARVMGAPVSQATGPRKGMYSAHFTGTDWAQSSSPVIDPRHSYAVAAWLRPTSLVRTMTAVSQLSGRYSAFYLGYNGPSRRFVISTLDTHGKGSRTEGTSAPLANQWHLVIGVMDSRTDTRSLYVDGRLEDTVPWSARSGQQAPGPFVVGRETYVAVPGNYWAGDIGPVAAYDAALTPKQVSALYRRGY
jgi:actin-like ATPase involved in cell morphogenesis